MNRAAVIIGVDKYPHGGLAQLQAAAAGAKQMAAWAEANGIEIALLTDDQPNSEITYAAVRDAVWSFVDRTGVKTLDQLIIYFGGHGVNVRGDEVWLLPGAPREGAEAVNLTGAANLARHCGIPHVVFVSDACRTIPASLAQSLIGGGDLFPNDDRGLRSNEIDRFFAARLGNVAQEAPVTEGEARTYQSVFTYCLLTALTGDIPDVIDQISESDQTIAVVGPRKLESYLETAVPRRVADLKLERAQTPDAYVETELPKCLSRLPHLVARGGRDVAPRGGLAAHGIQVTPEIKSPASAAAELLQSVISGEPQPLPNAMMLPQQEDLFTLRLIEEATALSHVTGRTHFETGAGFTVHGQAVIRADSRNAKSQIFDGDSAQHVSMSPDGGGELTRPASVLIEFSDGRGCVLPALPGYIGTAVMTDEGLINVSYVPSENSPLWDMYAGEAERLNRLRSLVAAASRERVFRVDRENAGGVARQIRYLKSIDPTLGLYAAYAYNDAGLTDEAAEVGSIMRREMGVALFDVEMITRRPGGEPETLTAPGVTPFCPMLSQGWALLSAKRVHLPEPVSVARRHLADSLWTLFEPPGVRALRDAILSGAVQ